MIPLVFAAGLIACGGSDGSATTTSTIAITTGLIGTVSAGPICPVESDPPDPDCASRPVADARIIVFDSSGATIAHVITGASGEFTFDLRPGAYEVVAEPVQGFLGFPDPVDIVVDDGFVTISLEYDTGIR